MNVANTNQSNNSNGEMTVAENYRTIEQIFYNAMRVGYALGTLPTIESEMSGAKGIPYQEGYFYLLDSWETNPDTNRFMGEIKIWRNKIPVWGMQYFGYYPEYVQKFLKEVLLASYEKREFIGGRGPRHIEDSECVLVYTNKLTPGSEFWGFSGSEAIIDKRRAKSNVGWCRYQGFGMGWR